MPATGGVPATAGVPAFLERPGRTAWHRLNPLTKLVAAISTGIAALVAGGLVLPLLIVVVAVALPAILARVLRGLLRSTLVLTLPLAVSVLLVNLLFFPGGQEVLFRLGPLTASAEGLRYGVEVLIRLLAISGGVALFYLTTRPGDLTLDLERRGVPPRIAFVANASIGTVPAILERADAITQAQRARGLDTEGSAWARVRGVIPIVGPVILGSIADVEERTLALEARGFGRPGRRTLLRELPDSGRQRVARWAMLAVIPLLPVLRGSLGLP